MPKSFRKLKLNTMIVVLTVLSFAIIQSQNSVYAFQSGYAENKDMKDSAYEHMGFISAEQKALADKLFIPNYSKDQTEIENISLELTALGKQMANAMGLTDKNKSDISKFVGSISSEKELVSRINATNNIRSEINKLMSSTSVSGNKESTRIDLVNGVYVLTGTGSGKSVLPPQNQQKLNELIEKYKKETGIEFEGGDLLDLLKFDASGGENGLVDFEFTPNYKHFKYLEKVVFTIKRIDGNGRVTAVLPYSQELNIQKNSSISKKYKSVTSQVFPVAQISNGSIVYDFSNPVFGSGGDVNDKIRDKWSGSTNYNPAIAIKVSSNGMYDVTAKVYGGTYIEESKEFNSNISVQAKPKALSTKPQPPKKPGIMASEAERTKYKKDKAKYDTAIKKWNEEKIKFDTWNGKDLGEENNTISQNISVAEKYYNSVKANTSKYNFNVKYLDKGILESRELLLCNRKFTSEYWPYKENYEMKSFGKKYPLVDVVSTVIDDTMGPVRPYPNSLPTYVAKKTNKAPDNQRSNQLLASYNWRVGVVEDIIVIPAPPTENAQIGSSLTK